MKARRHLASGGFAAADSPVDATLAAELDPAFVGVGGLILEEVASMALDCASLLVASLAGGGMRGSSLGAGGAAASGAAAMGSGGAPCCALSSSSSEGGGDTLASVPESSFCAACRSYIVR